MIDRLNFLHQLACHYAKQEEKKEIRRLLDKAGQWQRITDAELKYIDSVESALLSYEPAE